MNRRKLLIFYLLTGRFKFILHISIYPSLLDNNGNQSRIAYEIILHVRGRACDTECRRWCIHPGFKTHGRSQPKSETQSIRGSIKW